MVKKKCKRLGLEVVGAKGYKTTTSLKSPKELPSVEDALNLLAAALKSAAGRRVHVTGKAQWDTIEPEISCVSKSF